MKGMKDKIGVYACENQSQTLNFDFDRMICIREIHGMICCMKMKIKSERELDVCLDKLVFSDDFSSCTYCGWTWRKI